MVASCDVYDILMYIDLRRETRQEGQWKILLIDSAFLKDDGGGIGRSQNQSDGTNIREDGGVQRGQTKENTFFIFVIQFAYV